MFSLCKKQTGLEISTRVIDEMRFIAGDLNPKIALNQSAAVSERLPWAIRLHLETARLLLAHKRNPKRETTAQEKQLTGELNPDGSLTSNQREIIQESILIVRQIRDKPVKREPSS